MWNREIRIELGERERKEAAAARRFPVSVSSETPVTRRIWDGAWQEVLSHARDAVDLSRAPLPVLEGHDRSRVNVGIVQNLKLDGKRLRGELVLGSSARALELSADIADGIVTGLSVGYSIDREERDEKAKRITATRWTPFEVSIVSVPADVTVGIGRSHTMDPQNPANPAPPPPLADEATRTAVELATRAERERVATITELASRHADALDPAFAQDLIRRGVTLEQARSLMLDRLASRDTAIPTISHIRMDGERNSIAPGNDYAEDFHRAAIDALLLRSGIRVEKPHAAARDVSASVFDLARTCLSRAGKSASRMFGGEARGPELLKRAATTADFPAILEGALHAAVRSGYENEPATHRRWVRVAPFVDFREAKRPILGSAPELKKVSEGGEYASGYFLDDGTGYKVEKFGRIVALSWEVLVNDNLGAFLRVQPALGQAARRLEADTVYALFALNTAAGPTMNDTKALFHADHKNLIVASSVNSAALGAARALLRRQTAVGGGYLSLVPRFWIVPPEFETEAETIIANASRRMTTEKSTAEWISNLELVVEPRLPSTAHYLAADSAQIDTIELGLLEENMSGPHMETEQGFDTDESRWKIRHTAGAKAIDWRGMVKMPISP